MDIKLIARKLANFLSRGKMLELDVTPKIPTAKVGLMAKEIYDGIEYPQDYGFKSFPPKGSECITGHFGGNRNHGTIFKAWDKNSLPEITEEDPFEEGEVILYSKFGTKIKLNKDGNIVIDAPIVAITGDLLVDGTINGVTIPPEE